MEYLKTDAEIMQVLLDGEKVDEIDSKGNLNDVLKLVRGDIRNEVGGQTHLSKVFNYAIHVEPKWYESLSPDKPMMCTDYSGEYCKAESYREIDQLIIASNHYKYSPDQLTPLTREEIQVFKDSAPEDV